MKICSIEGCGKRVDRRGWCAMHYMRWRRHGDPYTTRWRPHGLTAKQVVDREIDRAARSEGGCLLTTAYRNASGHGLVAFGGRQVLLHRFVFEVMFEWELGEGEQVNHACHRPSCINPLHLYVGTQPENLAHYRRAGLSIARKLTIEQVREIRREIAQGTSRRAISDRFGITQGAVGLIERGLTWRGVS